jgi:proteasome lid subunit RPN8/RPN11
MLILGSADRAKIVDHCIAVLPNEACGILAGRGGAVLRVIAMTNAEPSPAFYVMDPGEQFKVMKELRQAGLDLVGIYHSHTGSRAYPSATDVQLASYPEAVYVIVSLMDRENPEVRGFSLRDGVIDEVPLAADPEKG